MRRLLAFALLAAFVPGAAFAQSAIPKPVTNARSTVTTGATAGVFVVAKAQEVSGIPLMGCQVTNTGTLSVSIDTGLTPSTTTARPLAAGATFDCAEPYGTILVEQINVAPTTAAAATVVVWIQR